MEETTSIFMDWSMQGIDLNRRNINKWWVEWGDYLTSINIAYPFDPPQIYTYPSNIIYMSLHDIN